MSEGIEYKRDFDAYVNLYNGLTKRYEQFCQQTRGEYFNFEMDYIHEYSSVNRFVNYWKNLDFIIISSGLMDYTLGELCKMEKELNKIITR